MPKITFDAYKSVNQKIHNKLVQFDQYENFLKRIDNIVDRKRKVDRSSELYMSFLNKSREKSNQQKFIDKEYLIQLENKNLLHRIQKQKTRKFSFSHIIHEINRQGKRLRDQQKINQQNCKMAERIIKQNSYLASKRIFSIDIARAGISRISKQSQYQKSFQQKLKNKKLPKLVKSPTVSLFLRAGTKIL